VANTYTDLIYHIVFSTKERRPFIKEAVQADLYRYIGGIIPMAARLRRLLDK